MFVYWRENVKEGACDTQSVRARIACIAFVALISLLLAGCEFDDGQSTTTTTIKGVTSDVPGGADPADVEVIQGWVTTLAHGDVEGAAEYFALPSVAENGGIAITLETVEEARRFNESLPCGAKLIRAVPDGDLTTATFELTERPGGACDAPGERAKTTFEIENGEIVAWRRVPAGGSPPIEGTEI